MLQLGFFSDVLELRGSCFGAQGRTRTVTPCGGDFESLCLPISPPGQMDAGFVPGEEAQLSLKISGMAIHLLRQYGEVDESAILPTLCALRFSALPCS